MIFDFGVNPLFSIFIFFAVLIIFSDFVLEQFSIRLTLSMGRLQNWLFYNLGRNVFKDSAIALCFHLLSFRKRAFFLQIFSFFNVGSFSKKQIFYILFGSFVGLGVSSLILICPNMYLAILILPIGFVLRLQRKEQLKDLGMALISIALFFLLLNIFDFGLAQSSIGVYHFDLPLEVLFIAVILTSILFQTPIAFFLSVAFYHLLVGMNPWLMAAVFFVHGVALLTPLYFSILNKQKRLYFSLFSVIIFQIIQLVVSFVVLLSLPNIQADWLQATTLIGALQKVILCYFLYFSLTLTGLIPLIFFLKNFSFLKEDDFKRKPSQKIISPQKRGGVFSIHFSLFLLRHEFNKMATLVHTVLKLGREADCEDEDVNEKLFRYQGILSRVGNEIKDFCFSVGKQRAYRWQIKEILSYYKAVNRLELMVEDLSQIIGRLQVKEISEAWEKECRFWLNLQLRTYEVFFSKAVGVPFDEEEKVTELIEKSYESLERIQKLEGLSDEYKDLSKAFYRVTESNSSLSLE